MITTTTHPHDPACPEVVEGWTSWQKLGDIDVEVVYSVGSEGVTVDGVKKGDGFAESHKFSPATVNLWRANIEMELERAAQGYVNLRAGVRA